MAVAQNTCASDIPRAHPAVYDPFPPARKRLAQQAPRPWRHALGEVPSVPLRHGPAQSPRCLGRRRWVTRVPIEARVALGGRGDRDAERGRHAISVRGFRVMPHFSEADSALLESAVALVPDLHAAAYGAKLARERLTFPLREYSDLAPLFGDRGSVEFEGRTFALEHVRRFLPLEFFPIDNEHDFLLKIFLSLHRGAMRHAQEEIHSNSGPPSPAEGVTLLPSPSPVAIDLQGRQ
jgi:hypothetical protein